MLKLNSGIPHDDDEVMRSFDHTGCNMMREPMAKKKTPRVPGTQAVRALRAEGVAFEPMFYTYEEQGGTSVAARELEVDRHHIVKSLVFEDDTGDLLMILMHGDRSVAPGMLARAIGARSTHTATFEKAHKSTGYMFGGTSPFGMLRPIPVYAQQSIQDLECLYINGGRRGLLVRITPEDLARVTECMWVEVAKPVDTAYCGVLGSNNP